MSLTIPAQFECPYCMVINDLEIDQDNDIGQQQIVDCQICCQPIELAIYGEPDSWIVDAKREDD